MYNVYVKRKIFIITKIVLMNEKTRLSSEKEKIKESQTVTNGGTPTRHPLSGAGSGASQCMVERRGNFKHNISDPSFSSTFSSFFFFFFF